VNSTLATSMVGKNLRDCDVQRKREMSLPFTEHRLPLYMGLIAYVILYEEM